MEKKATCVRGVAYLLPASLILLLSIDLSIYNLGPKAIVMFFAATAGIVMGPPLAGGTV